MKNKSCNVETIRKEKSLYDKLLVDSQENGERWRMTKLSTRNFYLRRVVRCANMSC